MITIPNEYFNKQVLVILELESPNDAIKANRKVKVNAATYVSEYDSSTMIVYFAIEERFKKSFTNIMFRIRGSRVEYPALPDSSKVNFHAKGTAPTGILDFTLGKVFLTVKHL